MNGQETIPPLPDWAKEVREEPPLPVWASEAQAGPVGGEIGQVIGREKGPGYFGALKRPDGMISTELSIGVTGPEYGNKETQIPLLVPTLTRNEIAYLLSGKEPTPEIIKKAEIHAQIRLSKGLSPFAQAGPPLPEWAREIPTRTPLELGEKSGLGYIVGETLKGTGQDIVTTLKNLVKQSGQLVKYGVLGIQEPEQAAAEFYAPTPPEVGATPKTIGRGALEVAKGLGGLGAEFALFAPKVWIKFAENPRKQIMEDPLGTLMALSVFSGLGKATYSKFKAGRPVKGTEIHELVDRVPDKIAPPEMRESIKSQIPPETIVPEQRWDIKLEKMNRPMSPQEFNEWVLSGDAAIRIDNGKILRSESHQGAWKEAWDQGLTSLTPEQIDAVKGERAGWKKGGKFYSISDLDNGKAYQEYVHLWKREPIISGTPTKENLAALDFVRQRYPKLLGLVEEIKFVTNMPKDAPSQFAYQDGYSIIINSERVFDGATTAELLAHELRHLLSVKKLGVEKYNLLSAEIDKLSVDINSKLYEMLPLENVAFRAGDLARKRFVDSVLPNPLAEATRDILKTKEPTGEIPPPMGGGGLPEIPGLLGETDVLFMDTIKEVQKKKQAGYIKMGGGPPPVVLDPKVAKVLGHSALPLLIKDRIKYKSHELAAGVKKWMVYEPTLKEEPRFKNELRLFQDTPIDAIAESNKRIVATVGKLSGDEMRVFESYVGLKSLEGELLEGRNVPGGLTIQDIQSSLAQIERAKTVNIVEAISRHERFTELERQDLIQRGKMVEEQGKDFYFPHRVLDYTPEWANWKGVPKRFSKPFRNYLVTRKGTTRAIDFDYIGAMQDHYAKVYLDNALEDFMDISVKKYDISGKVAGNKDIFGPSGKPRAGGIYEIGGKEYKGFQFERGQVIYPAKTINEGLWQKAVDEGWTAKEFEESVGPQGGQSIRDAFALGGAKKVNLLPTAIAERLEKFRTPGPNLPLFWELRNVMSIWKRVTLDVAGIPFQVGNFFGDFINLYKTDPAAATKIAEASDLVGKFLYAPDQLTTPQWEFIKTKGLPERVLTTHFLREVGINLIDSQTLRRLQSPSPLNYLGHILGFVPHAIEKAGIGRELILRTAKFLKDLERISKGEQIVAGEIDIRGLDPINAAGKISREFTVDYGAVSPHYRGILRGWLAPFLTFYDYNARNWGKYVVKNPGNAAMKFGVPMAAMWTWNNTGERKEIEENLAGYYKYLPHIITGYKTKDGKPIILALQTPVDMAASWVGLDRLASKITDIRAGKITIQEAAIDQLKDTALGGPRNVVRLLNPFIQLTVGLLTNRDPYTGKVIVPDRFKGTQYEKRFMAEYSLTKIVTPFGQYMRAQQDLELNARYGTWGAWLLKGPLDAARAIGIRAVNLDAYKMMGGYDIREKLSNEVKNKLAMLELEWIKSNTMRDEFTIPLKSQHRGEKYMQDAYKRIIGMKGQNPTDEQVVNRLFDLDTQVTICDEIIKLIKDEGQRKNFLDYRKQLKIQKYVEGMSRYAIKAIRPDLWQEIQKFGYSPEQIQ